MRESLGYIAVFVASPAISYLIIGCICLGSAFMQLAANAVVAIVVTGIAIILALHRTGSFRFFVGMMVGKAKKFLRRQKNSGN